MRPRRAEKTGRGQVLIEILLVLPIFMYLIFMIMEIGHLSFRAILLHHAAYEVARIGSLTANAIPSPNCVAPSPDWGRMQTVAGLILPGSVVGRVGSGVLATLPDRQEGCTNYDVAVELRQLVPMVFPMTGIFLANTSDRRSRLLKAQVRMPIERPLFK